jgi:hypothetical protein
MQLEGTRKYLSRIFLVMGALVYLGVLYYDSGHLFQSSGRSTDVYYQVATILILLGLYFSKRYVLLILFALAAGLFALSLYIQV